MCVLVLPLLSHISSGYVLRWFSWNALSNILVIVLFSCLHFVSEQRKKFSLVFFNIRNKTTIYPLLCFHLQDRMYPLTGLKRTPLIADKTNATILRQPCGLRSWKTPGWLKPRSLLTLINNTYLMARDKILYKNGIRICTVTVISKLENLFRMSLQPFLQRMWTTWWGSHRCFLVVGARADYKPREDRPVRELGKAVDTWNR
jgi:hypothetical protein